MNVLDFYQKKQKQEKISMVTCYDFWSAQILAQSTLDCILVGDSAAMVMHGYANTLPASIDMMVYHIQAVAKGAPNQFIIGDLPFCSYRKNRKTTMDAVEKFMHAGSHAIKLEGAQDNLSTISYIVQSGVPVMGHIGLTPQAVHALGGFKVQGRNREAALKIIEEAKSLQDAGCFAVVLECVPPLLAQEITLALDIPTIGIGAGPHTDGQVLVWHDLLGLLSNKKPKFVKEYINGFELLKNALNDFDQEVKNQLFPTIETHSYL